MTRKKVPNSPRQIRGRIDKVCKFCGGGFRVPPSGKHKQYCGSECYWKDMRIERDVFICAHCGDEFKQLVSRGCIYCSFACSVAARQSPPVVKECPTCHEVFKVPAHRAKQIHCSPQCNQQRRKKISLHRVFTCQFCGKQFEALTCAHRKYCSAKCKVEGWRKLPHVHTCKHCGKEFANKKKTQMFCSNSCSGKAKQRENHFNWKGGRNYYYGENWNSQSKKARERDGYTCQACGCAWVIGGNLFDVHHIKPFRNFDNNYIEANKLNNLITLCRTCHPLVEWNKIPCPIPMGA